MSTTTRRTVLTALATSPALAVPAIADPLADAELLALRPELEGIISEYLAKQADDDARQAAFDAAVEKATGLPRHKWPSVSEEGPIPPFPPGSFWDLKHGAAEAFHAADPHDPDLEDWGALRGRMHPLIDRILDLQPKTLAGLAIFARAASLSYDDWHSGQMGAVIDALCAFCGVEPVLTDEDDEEAES